jgi:hypothetical protein
MSSCRAVYSHSTKILIEFIHYSKLPVIWYPSIWNFHHTGKNSEKIYHFCKFIQKQISDAPMFICHSIVLPETAAVLSIVLPHAGVITAEVS